MNTINKLLLAGFFALNGCVAWDAYLDSKKLEEKIDDGKNQEKRYFLQEQDNKNIIEDILAKEKGHYKYYGHGKEKFDRLLDGLSETVFLDSIYSRSDALTTLWLIDEKIRFEGIKIAEDQWFSRGLLTDSLDCDDLTQIYIELGKRYDIPLRPVLYPRHMMVRWMLNDKEYINWETTKGVEMTDKDYYDMFKDTTEYYGKTLTDEQLLALADMHIGYQYYGQIFTKQKKKDIRKNMTEALGYFEKALRVLPELDQLNYLAANTYLALQDDSRSFEYINKAIDLNNNNHEYYVTRSYLYQKRKDYDNAINDINMALYIRPSSSQLYMTRSELHTVLGNDEAALNDKQNYIELDKLRRKNKQ